MERGGARGACFSFLACGRAAAVGSRLTSLSSTFSLSLCLSPVTHQAAAIPAALAGQDVLARARTGTGKTLAYLLPALHAIAAAAAAAGAGGAGGGGGANAAARSLAAGWQALILVPTRELVEQVCDAADALAAASGLHVRVSSLAGPPAAGAQRGGGGAPPASASPVPGREAAPARAGPLVVTTPGRLAAALRDGRLRPAMLAGPAGGRRGAGRGDADADADATAHQPASTTQHHASTGPLRLFAIDEADLLLALPGYAADVAAAAPALPRGVPTMLLSATAAGVLDELTSLVLQNPAVVDVTGGEEGCVQNNGHAALFGAAPTAAGASAALAHHYWDCPDANGRLAALVALLKLDAVARRVLIFVGTDAAGVRARLALAAFGLRAARLGAAMPLNSRHHALAEFNKGVFDYLIATDDGRSVSGEEGGAKEEAAAPGPAASGAASLVAAAPAGKNKRRRPTAAPPAALSAAAAAEFGVVRGVDFKGVRTVINFDAPASATAYVHRAGRAGRWGGGAGVVVTLFQAQPSALPPPSGGLPPPAMGRKRGAAMPPASGAPPPPPPPLSRAALEAALGGGGGAAGARGAAPPPLPPATRLAALLGSWGPYPHLSAGAPAALRYRVDDVARGLTRSSIKEALAQELRRELLNSARLASHFAARPADLALLRHDAPLTAAGRAAAAGGAVVGGGGMGLGGGVHLSRVPAYLRAAVGVGERAALAGLGGRPTASARRPPPKKRARAVGAPDPLKAGGGAAPALPAPATFAVAPKRGHASDLTPAEAAAEAAGRKAARKAAKKAGRGGGAFAAAPSNGVDGVLTGPRRNTLKGKHRRR